MKTLAKNFRGVDKVADTELQRMIQFLRFMDKQPAIAAYKTRAIERLNLRPGQIVVDLGCGLGFDTQSMAALVNPHGKAIGVDNSEKFLTVARDLVNGKQGIEFKCCDIHRLPFDKDSIDAILVSRTLQHV